MKTQLTLAGLALLLGLDPALAQEKIKLGVVVTLSDLPPHWVSKFATALHLR